MRWACDIQQTEQAADAVATLAERLGEALEGQSPDLLLLFPDPNCTHAEDGLLDAIGHHFPQARIAGCSAAGTIAAGGEWEKHGGLTLVAARLPGVRIGVTHLETAALPDPDASPAAWRALFAQHEPVNPKFIVLADPFSPNVDTLMEGLDFAYPDCPKVGGLASGMTHPGEHEVYADGTRVSGGVVVVTLDGEIEMDTVVAQGYRPIGQALRVTACSRNVLQAVEGEPPLVYLQSLVEGMTSYDRSLLQHSLFLGVETDPLLGSEVQRNFLIRNLISIDTSSGEAVIAEQLTPGQIVQFHLRDRRAAADDLYASLARYANQNAPIDLRGALLFSCMGRGMNLYGESGHDSRIFREHFGELPLGGMFCNGEIGQVGRNTYIHGYTSAFAIFRLP